MIEIPNLKVTRKIKSMQSFKESVNSISAGDRAGICVQSIESDSIERTLITSDKHKLLSKSIFLLEAKKTKYFKGELKSKSKFHISILNEVVLCKQILIVRPTVYGFEYLERVEGEEFHVIVESENPVNILPGAIVIGSKFDADPSLQKCRIAFYGKWDNSMDLDTKDFMKKIYKLKHKFSLVDRIIPADNRLIGRGIVSESVNEKFKSGKDSSLHKYIGMKVSIYKNELPFAFGVIESLFGSSGKFNVSIKSGNVESDPKDLYMKLLFGKSLDKSVEKFIEIIN